jgi:hypothetical protein
MVRYSLYVYSVSISVSKALRRLMVRNRSLYSFSLALLVISISDLEAADGGGLQRLELLVQCCLLLPQL